MTPATVQRAAAAYLKPGNRTAISVVPGGTRPPASTPAAADPTANNAISLERFGRAPISKEVLRVSLARPKESTLDNGLTLLVAEDHRAPLIAVRFEIRGAGRMQDPPDAPGTASTVAAMLRQGTARTSRISPSSSTPMA